MPVSMDIGDTAATSARFFEILKLLIFLLNIHDFVHKDLF